MSQPTITAALIVRNEELNLARCLTSLAGLVDEIVVVDTGSVDRTVEIAAGHGARVHERPWMGDFSNARNASLDLVATDWALIIDADEEVVDADPAAIGEMLHGSDEVAAWVRHRPRPRWTWCDELRIVRADQRVRFRGRVHETIHPAIARIHPHRVPSLRLPLAVHHHGYDDPQLHRAKAQRDLAMIDEAEADARPLLWAAIGSCYERLGDPSGASNAYARGSSLGDASSTVLLLESQLRSGNLDRALLRSALEYEPDDIDLLWLAARDAARQGAHADAIRLATRLLETDPTQIRLRSRPSAILDSWPCELIGRCHVASGCFGLAVAWLDRAAASDHQASPGDEIRIRGLRTLAARLAERAA